MTQHEDKICVIGLGYVGLPLAVLFSAHYDVQGYDVDKRRIAALEKGEDDTGEVSRADLARAKRLSFVKDIAAAGACTIYIITVPTPVDSDHRPDLRPLENAVDAVGSVLKPGDLVIVESTVYPGATEDVCVPRLEKASGLEFNKDFYCGYSPERMRPASTYRLADVVKVTAGSTPETAARVDALYRRIIRAGTHRAPTIRIAEAAKVVENTQRDLNIALVNELAMIFDTMGIDTHEVLEAAETKWDFHPFVPGLVGGHCIGVDPYYLTYKAQELGYQPNLILAARRLNNSVGAFIADKLVQMLIARGRAIKGARVLLLGLAFKENCPDIRNTRVIDIIALLDKKGCRVDVCDPLASVAQAKRAYGIALIDNLDAALRGDYDAVVFAVAHDAFKSIAPERLGDAIILDVKGIAERSDWRL